jgi:hypothetical protein
MSQAGIEKFAAVLSHIQHERGELLRMGSQPGKIDKQDIRLAQLLEQAKDAVKKEFAEITVE